jgi:hypothetical protein
VFAYYNSYHTKYVSWIMCWKLCNI